jgi:hypothetical protein
LLPHDVTEAEPDVLDADDDEDAGAEDDAAAEELVTPDALLELELELELHAASTPSDSAATAATAVRVRQLTVLFMCSAFSWLCNRYLFALPEQCDLSSSSDEVFLEL